jgi:alpha-mannosidase
VQDGEDPKYSEVAQVDLKKVFGKRTVSRKFAAVQGSGSGLLTFFYQNLDVPIPLNVNAVPMYVQIKELTETNLSANQKKSEMKKLDWRVIGDTESGPAPVKGGPVDCRALVVALGPMEIRTFLLKF